MPCDCDLCTADEAPLATVPEFSLGVTVGMLWERMLRGTKKRIRQTLPVALHAEVLSAVRRCGWEVVEMRPAAPGWFYVSLKRGKRLKAGVGS